MSTVSASPSADPAAAASTDGAPPGRRGPFFYGWWIVIGGFGMQTLNGSLLLHSFGAYVVLLQDDFGWSRTSLALAFSLQRAESGLLGPLQGWMLDRFGPRRVMYAGVVIFGVGFMLFSQIDSLPAFYATFLVIAIGSSLASFLSIATAVVNWFDRRRSMALAIMSIGLAAGGLTQPLVVAALDAFGWRSVAFASGVLVIVIGMPLSSLVRHRPEDYGYRPDGAAAPTAGSGTAAGGPVEVNFTAAQAMRTRAFWFIGFAHAAALLVIGAVMVHLVPHIHESLGYSLTAAASVVTLMTVFTVLGQLSGGYLGDRIDKRAIMAVAMVGHAVALLLLAFATALWMVVAFAVINGVAWGARGPLTQSLRADYFGRESFGTIMGFSSLIIMLGMTLGPVVAGLSYDMTGNYQSGFTLLAVVAGLGTFLFLFAKKPAPPATALATPLVTASPGGGSGARPNGATLAPPAEEQGARTGDTNGAVPRLGARRDFMGDGAARRMRPPRDYMAGMLPSGERSPVLRLPAGNGAISGDSAVSGNSAPAEDEAAGR